MKWLEHAAVEPRAERNDFERYVRPACQLDEPCYLARGDVPLPGRTLDGSLVQDAGYCRRRILVEKFLALHPDFNPGLDQAFRGIRVGEFPDDRRCVRLRLPQSG